MLPLPTPADLKAQRLRLRLTQAAVARAAGVSQPLVARIERGSVDPRLSTLRSLIDALNAAESRQVTLLDVMTADVVAVKPTDAVAEAIRTMRDGGYSQVPVVNKGVPVGSLSERNVVHALTTSTKEDLAKTPVREVMGPPFPTAAPGDALDAAMRLLEDHPAVLVMERGRLLGIVAKSNLLDTLK